MEQSLAVARRVRTGGLSINGGAPYGPDLPFGGSSTAASAARTASRVRAVPRDQVAGLAGGLAGRAPRDRHQRPEVYYDPYDFEIDADPYPVWKRLRDEAPLYWNEKYEFSR